MAHERLSLYHRILLSKIPEILSMQDREEMSHTSGCFDRTFWQWKFTDFPGARFQEALMTLAYVYSMPFEGNIYHANERVLKWIKNGFLYWCGLQHSDGSFDEAYPFERSFVATGFTLFYLTEAFRVVKDKLDRNSATTIMLAFTKAGDWLCSNEETHAFISNHRLGAAAGLYNLFELSNKSHFRQRSSFLTESVLAKQSRDGWFMEYGGADPGYLTQGIYYASVLGTRSKNPKILTAVEKAVIFASYFIHPDGTIGGEYGSRNTEFYFPGGFEIMASHMPVAEAICRKMSSSLPEGRVPSVTNTDAYNLMPLLNSLTTACSFFAAQNDCGKLPFERDSDFTLIFEDFKILVRKSYGLYYIVGIDKGGVLKVFDISSQKILKSCCGVFGRYNGHLLSSQSCKGFISEITGDKITVSGFLSEADTTLLSPVKMLIFRLLSLTLCAVPAGSRFLKIILVKTLISGKKTTDFHFKREIFIGKETGVKTEIENMPPDLMKEMDFHTSYHMGSSKYHKISELFAETL